MPLMSERDNVLLIHQKEYEDGQFAILKTIERDDLPEVPGIVRVFMFTRGLVSVNKESPHDTIDYTEISYFNMNGMFPTRLMNMIIASETKAGFAYMYKTILKENE